MGCMIQNAFASVVLQNGELKPGISKYIELKNSQNDFYVQVKGESMKKTKMLMDRYNNKFNFKHKVSLFTKPEPLHE